MIIIPKLVNGNVRADLVPIINFISLLNIALQISSLFFLFMEE